MAGNQIKIPAHLQDKRFGNPPRTLHDLVNKNARYNRSADSKARIGKAAEQYNIKSRKQRPSPSELLDINTQAGDVVEWAPGMRTFLTKLIHWLNKPTNEAQYFPDSDAKSNAWTESDGKLVDEAMALWEARHARDVQMEDDDVSATDEEEEDDRRTPPLAKKPEMLALSDHPQLLTRRDSVIALPGMFSMSPLGKCLPPPPRAPTQAPISTLRSMIRSLILNNPSTFEDARHHLARLDGRSTNELLRLGDLLLKGMRQAVEMRELKQGQD